jgi:hypothetical protein
MALIKQIKVGGTTYNIGINADAPLSMSGDTLRLDIGSGLKALDGKLDLFLSGDSLTHNNGIAVKVGSGLTTTKEGVSLLISGANEMFNRGLAFERGMLTLKLGSGLKFNSEGAIDLA